jgi:hypothetical protein
VAICLQGLKKTANWLESFLFTEGIVKLKLLGLYE